MSYILISTSRRHTTLNEPSGRLLVFDSRQNKIVRRCKIIEPPYRENDPNPRGGFRGLKGISLHQNKIAIANASTVFLYDKNWNPITYFWHPTCAGIHDIELYEDFIWVTSSRNDLLLSMNFSGEIISFLDLRKLSQFQYTSEDSLKSFLSRKQIINGTINFRDPSTHDHTITDLLHVNSMAFLDNGELLVSCGLSRKRKNFLLHKVNNKIKGSTFTKMYFKIKKYINQYIPNKNQTQTSPNKKTRNKSTSMLLRNDVNNKSSLSLILEGCTVPSHSVRILNDGSGIYLNTTNGDLIHFNPHNNEIFSSTSIGTRFLRGARQLQDDTILIGDNDYLIQFDLNSKKVLSRIKITDDPTEAVFDILLLPEYFSIPPESFVDLHNSQLPIAQV